MISSLANFLMLILYNGMYLKSVTWTLIFFTLGTVGVARVAIEKDRGYSIGYLGILTMIAFLAMLKFLDNPFSVAVLLGLIAYLSDVIVRDCTLIDEDEDASGEGLVDAGRHFVRKQLQELSTDDENGDSESGSQAAAAKPKRRKKVSQPGRTVMYLALAALPLFGIGQFFLRQYAGTWETAQMLLVLYLFASLSLLVTTSFLGLRRYLRQRRVDMPGNVSVAWIAGGLVMIGGILFLAYLAPLPGAALASFEMPELFQSRRGVESSQSGWGEEGAEEKTEDAATTGNDQRDRDKDEKGERYEPGGKAGDVDRGQRKDGPAGNEKGDGQKGAEKGNDSQGGAPSDDSKSQSQSQQSQKDSSGKPTESQNQSDQSQQSQSKQSQQSQSQSEQSQSSEPKNQSPQNGSDQKSQPPSKSSSQQDDGSKSSPEGQQPKSKQPDGQSQSDQQSDSKQNEDSKPMEDSKQQSPEDSNAQQDRSDSDPDSSSEPKSQRDSDKTDPENEDSSERDQQQREQELRDQQREQQQQEQNRQQEQRDADESSQSDSQEESQKESQESDSGLGQSINNAVSMLGGLIKLILTVVLGGIVVAFVWLNRNTLLAWLEQLLGGETRDKKVDAELITNHRESELPPRPFHSFTNPIGKESDPRRVVIITFQAFDAWAREQGWQRSIDETPSEFIRRIASSVPEMSSAAHQVIDAYNRIVYGRGRATETDVAAAGQLWRAMQD